jgi:hypothetical protein
MVSAPEYSTVVSASQPCICKWRRHSRRYLREGDPRIERQIVRIVVVKGGNLRAGRQRKLRLPMFEVSAFAPGDHQRTGFRQQRGGIERLLREKDGGCGCRSERTEGRSAMHEATLSRRSGLVRLDWLNREKRHHICTQADPGAAGLAGLTTASATETPGFGETTRQRC